MDELIRATAEATAESGGIPLDLAPLLAPYARHKHLTFRVEHLPAGARLSNGRNNGDRSWSLTSDDLEDLRYLPPAGAAETPTLAIRVFSLDGDYAATLAVLDVPVSSGDPAPAPAAAQSATDPSIDAELRRLRDELAALQAALAERAAELTAARTAWEAELNERLAKAAAEAATKLEASRAAWQTEHEHRFAASEKRAQEHVEQARVRWQQEAEAALAKTQASWKAEEAARLAGAEAQWRAQSMLALAEATARVEHAETALAAAHAQAKAVQVTGEAIELSRLRDELVVTQIIIAEREAALAETRQKAEGELSAARTAWEAELQQRLAKAAAEAAATLETRRAAWQAEQDDRFAKLEAQTQKRIEQARMAARQEARAGLSQAQEIWQADEAVRLAAAEARWQAQSARALAEATARGDRAEAALAAASAQPNTMQGSRDDAELARLRDDRAAMQAIIADRETELLEMRHKAEYERREASRLAIDAELSVARSAWESELQQRLIEATAQATTNLEMSRAAWQAELADRIAKSEARAQERFAQALAEATARGERAETALAEARAQPKAVRDPGDEAALARLRDELAAMRRTLATRETELAAARSAAEDARQNAAAEAQAALQQADEARKVEAAQPPAAEPALAPKVVAIPNNARGKFTVAMNRQRQAQLMRYAIRGGALAACLAGVVLLYPRVEAMIVDDWAPKIAALPDAIEPMFRNVFGPSKSSLPEPPPVMERPAVQTVERRTIISVSVASVRAGPSPAAAVITKLPRDREVSPVDRRGSWVLIRFDAEDGNRQEGWVSSTLLKDMTGH